MKDKKTDYFAILMITGSVIFFLCILWMVYLKYKSMHKDSKYLATGGDWLTQKVNG